MDEFNVRVAKDGNMWVACSGENIAEGPTGVGTTAAAALRSLSLELDELEEQKPPPEPEPVLEDDSKEPE